jgi:hypothetical protein
MAGDFGISEIASTASTADSLNTGAEASAQGDYASASGGSSSVPSGTAADSTPGESQPTTGAGSTGSLVGGAFDSLGISVGGWVDRWINKGIRQQNQANFDKQFLENQRRWGLTFALNEWATRNSIDISQAQKMWDNVKNSDASAMAKLEYSAAQDDLAEKRRKIALGHAFISGMAGQMAGGQS